jgi:hypothetical protein
MRALCLLQVLSACATAPEPEVVSDATPVIAAERAFATRAGEVGWVPAFREFVAPDGQLAQPTGYASAPAELAATEDDGNRNLFWWPGFAAISRSGDFGFTTGVVSFDEARTPRGHYFTVWRRQPDGSWKWIYDGGVGPIAEPGSLNAPGADVPMAATAASGEASAEAAVAAVTALEQAGGGRLAADARVFRTRQALAIGVAGDTPAGVAYQVSRIEASSGGDLVMVLGEASWTASGQAVSSLYARMWQRRASWQVIDRLIVRALRRLRLT